MASRAHRQPLPLATLSVGFVLIWLFLAAFPFLWTMWGAFKVEGDFFSRVDRMNAILGPKTRLQTGASFTDGGYAGAWIKQRFWKSVLNTAMVPPFVLVMFFQRQIVSGLTAGAVKGQGGAAMAAGQLAIR